MTDTHVILAGQSNALGYLNDGPAPWFATDRVQIFADTNADGVGDTWQAMAPGANTGTAANPLAWGPEVGFAWGWLMANPEGTLFISKTAKGSTGLAQDDGQIDWSPQSDGEMFDRAEASADAGRAALDGTEHAFDRWDSVLWMQGEQDGTDAAKAAAYADNLRGLVAEARADWDVDRFVVARITDSAAVANNEAVRVAQWALPYEDPGVASFKTIGFEMQDDGLHYDAIGHLQLGLGFWQSYDSLLGL